MDRWACWNQNVRCATWLVPWWTNTSGQRRILLLIFTHKEEIHKFPLQWLFHLLVSVVLTYWKSEKRNRRKITGLVTPHLLKLNICISDINGNINATMPWKGLPAAVHSAFGISDIKTLANDTWLLFLPPLILRPKKANVKDTKQCEYITFTWSPCSVLQRQC